MWKITLLLFVSLLFRVAAAGQVTDTLREDKLATLLADREQLILEYQFYNKQNSNFWGKKSKKDLLQIIQTLKNVINKDSEIIREINLTSQKKQVLGQVETGRIRRQIVDDQRMTMENLHQLRQELASMQNLQKAKDRQLAGLREELEQVRAARQKTDLLLVITGAFCLVLLVYIFLLRKKIPSAKNNRRSKNK